MVSKYTIQLRNICESLCDMQEVGGLNDVNQIIENSWYKLFDNFDIFDPSHRKELCIKIIKHYYMREIGFETPSLFKFYLNNTIQEIMPYYNERYKSVSFDFDPLNNKKITRELNNNTEGTNKATDESVNKYLNTPQNGLQDLANNRYLTDARMINSGVESSYSGKGKEVETITGKDGDQSYMELIKQYRENIINIDLEVIESLECCFMSIF